MRTFSFRNFGPIFPLNHVCVGRKAKGQLRSKKRISQDKQNKIKFPSPWESSGETTFLLLKKSTNKKRGVTSAIVLAMCRWSIWCTLFGGSVTGWCNMITYRVFLIRKHTPTQCISFDCCLFRQLPRKKNIPKWWLRMSRFQQIYTLLTCKHTTLAVKRDPNTSQPPLCRRREKSCKKKRNFVSKWAKWRLFSRIVSTICSCQALTYGFPDGIPPTDRMIGFTTPSMDHQLSL